MGYAFELIFRAVSRHRGMTQTRDVVAHYHAMFKLYLLKCPILDKRTTVICQ